MYLVVETRAQLSDKHLNLNDSTIQSPSAPLLIMNPRIYLCLYKNKEKNDVFLINRLLGTRDAPATHIYIIYQKKI